VPVRERVAEPQLVINEAEATTVRHIFTRYCELGSVRLLKEELDRNGVRSKIRVSKDGVESGGQAFSRGALYALLRNPIYVGEIRHKAGRRKSEPSDFRSRSEHAPFNSGPPTPFFCSKSNARSIYKLSPP